MGVQGVRETLMIAGGGTGGHIYPAIAIAQEWMARDARRGVIFVGTERGLEKTIVPKAGFPLAFISAGGLKGKRIGDTIKGLFRLPIGFTQAFSLVGKHHPNVVLGVGGYSSGPVLMAAKLRGVPTAIHESNAFPGLTNRILARFVTAAAVAFEGAASRMSRADAVITGNPIRKEFFSDNRQPTTDNHKRLLIFGGSQGSRVINDAMIGALLFMAPLRGRIDIVHQTGPNELEKVRQAYRASAFADARVVPYLDPIVDEIASADLVVSRSGAMTVGELAAAGRAAILIPFAAATDNHQELNARAVQQAGGAIVITERELSPERLAFAITEIVNDTDRTARMGARARTLAVPDATKKIVDLLEKIERSELELLITKPLSRMNLDKIKKIHFVGIGGIGMSGLAEILTGRGMTVTGCDLKHSSATTLLASRGVDVRIGHDTAHLAGVDAVVVTAAVRGANVEVDAARERGIEIIRRKELLAAIVDEKRGVGVSGTHGKTTTSAMIATVLEDAGLDPTVIIGGMLRNIASNAKSGAGDVIVVEADEYDRTFHELHPEVAVITNIEADHLEYYDSFDNIVEAFRIFTDNVKPGGAIIGCVDDPAVAALLKRRGNDRKIVRYGLGSGADLTARNLRFDERGSTFDVEGVGSFKLLVPGQHNVHNALAAIAVARELGVNPEAIARGVAKFLGVDRRFQILGDYNGALVVDDYAHHPTEIRATLDAARSGYPQRRVVALFQPHLYSRTRDFAVEFGESLRGADVAFVAPIYAAREMPIEGVSSRMIADATNGIEFLDRSHIEIINELRRRLQPDDVFIAMGAGDVHEIAEALVRGDEGRG